MHVISTISKLSAILTLIESLNSFNSGHDQVDLHVSIRLHLDRVERAPVQLVNYCLQHREIVNYLLPEYVITVSPMSSIKR